MRSVPAKFPEISRSMPFEQARSNFVAAARQGLSSSQVWLDGQEMPAAALTLDVLFPLAHEGLESAGVDAVRHRPLPRRHRAPCPLRLHRVAVGALVAELDAQPGQQSGSG